METQSVVSLRDLKVGSEARLTSLNTDLLQEKLFAMGIIPGRKIKLLKKFPSFVFQVGHSTFAVDKEVAKFIQVVPSENC